MLKKTQIKSQSDGYLYVCSENNGCEDNCTYFINTKHLKKKLLSVRATGIVSNDFPDRFKMACKNWYKIVQWNILYETTTFVILKKKMAWKEG